MPRESPDKAAISEYVSDRLTRELAERGAAERLAEALGFSSAHIANAKNHGSVGEAFGSALAGHWKLGGWDDLKREAGAWWKQRGGGPIVRLDGRDATDPYPARQEALARLRGLLSPAVATSLRGAAGERVSAWDALDWIDVAVDEERRARANLTNPLAATGTDASAEVGKSADEGVRALAKRAARGDLAKPAEKKRKRST